MQVDIITSDKHLLEVSMDNATVAEVLRVYLNEQGVQFAAWRLVHPDKPIVFRIETSGGTPQKAIKDAISTILKECKAISSVASK